MDFHLSEQSYTAFAIFLYRKVGIVLGSNRQYLVRSRLSTLARNNNYADFNVFIRDMINNSQPSLTNRCLELMTTNETFWFRDDYPFKILSQTLLPALAKNKTRLKIWSSACASGQEAYSVAMVIKDYMRQHSGAFRDGVDILATDFSSEMIEKAKEGKYDEFALGRGLPRIMRDRYFDRFNSQSMQISDNIKSMVRFQRINLLGDYQALGQFDVIFCRNVLIYFDGNQKITVLKKIAACLPKNGILFLGAAESINGAESIFTMHTINQGLHYSKL